MNIEEYLSKDHSSSTVKSYLFEINHLVSYLGEDKALNATYKDIEGYLCYLRERYPKPNTINRILQAIKQYYFYLLATEQRAEHPCRYIRLRDKSRGDIQVQDLLTENDLGQLLKRKERYGILKIRNQVGMGLLIYQALLLKEIAQLEVGDLDLSQASIRIRSTRKTNGRTLSLHPQQIMPLHEYMEKIRPQLLKAPTPALLLSKRGTPEKGEGLHYLCETFRPLFPNKRLSPLTIRQSVIANLLKSGKNLRLVQVFAGHKKISSTEKYKQSNLEALKLSVQKFHPLQ